ncbi:D-alanyl-D-alanine carboxypeptidase [Loktanella fryxellensis]|uniref:D-alanyl-D-alanine carboxypeptidase n=1 Tax=Loktanella fryxellensis TaxID=245187 RepID=A0A1H8IR57_9RHOB|nr:M15 family metallopeptidase [Loktanella fryxellensis]SEN70585.1 D-alanyl-D-alanine carboxypeptidase [Loktanella fryxellensis]
MTHVWTTSHTQMLLASAGYYKKAIDGSLNASTQRGISIVINNAGGLMSKWSARRREIAAGQIILNVQGRDAGLVNGYAGHNTLEALTDWLSKRMEVTATVERLPAASRPDPKDLPRQADIAAIYGSPAIPANTTYALLDFDMRLDWDLGSPIRKLRVHHKCATALVRAITAVRAHYGHDKWQALGLDRYAGGYNPRRMRGGTSWSMHAYGCAVDFFAAPNGLRARAPEALFSRPDYRPFLDIMEAHNWLPALRLWGADAMHFQMARL